MSIDQQTKVLNDLDEKVRKMAELIIEKPSIQKVIYKLEKRIMSFGFVLMLMLCGKGMCLMIINGKDGYNG